MENIITKIKNLKKINLTVLKYYFKIFIRTQPYLGLLIIVLEIYYLILNFAFVRAVVNLDNDKIKSFNLN
jgi:hypothetical protein